MANSLKTFLRSSFPTYFGANVTVGPGDTYQTDKVDLTFGSKNTFKSNDATNISTVFTCIKILSDTISRLPLNIYQEDEKTGRIVDKSDYRYNLLHYNPNNYTTSQTFFAALEYFRNIHGNAFARINRNTGTGRPVNLELLLPGVVIGYSKVNNELYYLLVTKVDGREKKEMVNANDILHFKMVTKDGVMGASPIEALRLNLSSTWKGMNTIDSFYENNALSPKALQSNIPDAAYRAKQKEAVADFKKNYTGPRNAGEMIILPEYTEIQELSISLADAEFIATVKFNALQIAALYGVPPHLIGEFTATKFSSVEQMALDFKTNTVDAIARMYRQEMEFKLLTTAERTSGKTIEFNFMAFVAIDAKTRFEGYKTLFSLGVKTPNQIAKLEGEETFEGGDGHFIPANTMSIEVYNAKNTNPQPDTPKPNAAPPDINAKQDLNI